MSGSRPVRVPPGRTAAAPLVLALVATIGFAGCASNSSTTASRAASSSPAAGGCATESTAGTAGVNLLPIPPAKVTVTDAGAGDRRVPASTPQRSSPQSVTVTTTSSVNSAGDQDSQSVALPMTGRFGCTDATDLELTLGPATSPDTALADQLRPVDGSRAGLAIGPGTMPISLRLLPAAQAGPEARSAVEQALVQALQLSVPLPTQPIAMGAQWTAERTISAAVTVTQRIDARLRSWTGDRLVVDVTVDETPVNSVFTLPGSGETLQISRFANSGTGEVTMDLRRGLPVGGQITMTGARELVGTDPAHPLLQQTGLSVQWR